ncbi:unnamed protein product [Schistosoma turkestanicum]|nr:unnamed protein product [Schistosoma turkestanicum]
MDADFYSGSDELQGPDTLYLIRHVGTVLRQYIAEVVMKRPVDPIDYLGRCLKNYIKIRDAELKESMQETTNELINLPHFKEPITSFEIENQRKTSRVTTIESKNDEYDMASKHQSDDEMLIYNEQLIDSDPVIAAALNENDTQEANQLQSSDDTEKPIREVMNEADEEQSTLKFDNETDDDITFESPIQQELNETPIKDTTDPDDQDETEEAGDSEI